MRLVCDLHLHSRYSLATSRSLNLESLATAGNRVGIDLLAAPDFTHPIWRAEMRTEMDETQPGSGIYIAHDRNFMLVSEVSCIWRQDGRARRVHLLVAAPNFDAVDKMCQTFATLQNLESDGRPIFKISATELFEIVRDADPRCEIVPAHVYTPWYGIFGTKSGFDSLEQCFGEWANEIIAVESGLSADPSMLWSVPETNARSIVSFSDAHSVGSLGREATVLDVGEMSYDAVIAALRNRDVIETYEFHPEHGKYHYDGHRKCGVKLHPETSNDLGGKCPECQRPMTLGVLNRAVALSNGKGADAMRAANGVWRDPDAQHPQYRHLVPLKEILAHVLSVGKSTKRVERVYIALTDAFDDEFNVLLNAPEHDIAAVCEREDVARAIINVRVGKVIVEPGYDGVYGTAIPIDD